MTWDVEFHAAFDAEFEQLPVEVQDERLIAKADARFDAHLRRLKG